MPTAGLIGSQHRRDDQPPSPGTVARLLAAFNEGLVDTAGAPVDLVNGALRWGGVPVSDTPFGGSANLRDMLHGVGIGQIDQQFAPQSGVERYGQSVARSLGQVALPVGATLGVGGKLATAPGMFAGGSVGRAIRPAMVHAAQNPATTLLANGGSAVGAGVGGQVARDSYPGNFWIDLAGQLLGGGAGGLTLGRFATGNSVPTRSEIGPFGPIHADVGRNWNAGLARLRAQGGEIPGAIQHPEIGPVDIVWGKPNIDGKGGYGLAKIEEKHPEVIKSLPRIVEELPVKERPDQTGNGKFVLSNGRYRAIVAPDYLGDPKRWLVTAFEEE